ncbi:MAG TPA: alpha/beta hydrolase [Polyangiaceae bacterium]|nr:alpha/beta hydrolase [Polyangiaceae bacterium]
MLRSPTVLLALATTSASACQPEARRHEQARPAPSTSASTKLPASPAALPPGDPRFDAELSGSSYPFPVSYFEFTSQRQPLRMAYLDVAAEKPNGRTVLLLHGKNFSAAYWEPTIRLLTSHGFRVIAPDQIGFGKSSKPQSYQFSFQALAENTRALLDRAGVARVAVVGHSMGGMLATRFALQFASRTEKLALVSPIGLEDWRRFVAPRSVDEWYASELKATPDSIRAYQTKAYYGGQWKPEYEPLIAFAAGWTQHPDYPKVAWCSALTYDMIFNQPVLYEFPDVRVPALLIVGLRDRTALGKDWATPDVAAKLGDYTLLGKRAAAAIPNAKLVEFDGTGHLPQVEAFDRYSAALLNFLH